MKNGQNQDSLDALATRACAIAANGAVHYLLVNGLTADSNALAACLRSWVKAKMQEALHDAEEALACHMTSVAEATFAATMIQAGIEAAKEASRPDSVYARAAAIRQSAANPFEPITVYPK